MGARRGTDSVSVSRGRYAWQYPPIGTFIFRPRDGFQAFARENADAAREYAEKWAPEVPFEVVDRSEAAVPALLDASERADVLVTGARAIPLQRCVGWVSGPSVCTSCQMRRDRSRHIAEDQSKEFEKVVPVERTGGQAWGSPAPTSGHVCCPAAILRVAIKEGETDECRW